MELDRKNEEDNQARSPVNTQIQELITPRRDTNTILEVQSTPRTTSSEGRLMEKSVAVTKVESLADKLRPVRYSSTRKLRKTSRLEIRPIPA